MLQMDRNSYSGQAQPSCVRLLSYFIIKDQLLTEQVVRPRTHSYKRFSSYLEYKRVKKRTLRGLIYPLHISFTLFNLSHCSNEMFILPEIKFYGINNLFYVRILV